MARGKYAKRAAGRADRESLVSEGRAAALAAERAARERDVALAKAEKQEALYRAELAALRQHVAGGTSPELVRVLDLAEERRKRIEELEREVREVQAVRLRTEGAIAKAIARIFGVTMLEADEIVLAAASGVIPDNWDVSKATIGVGGRQVKKDTLRKIGQRGLLNEETAVALDHAKGRRSSNRRLAEAAVLAGVVYVVQQGHEIVAIYDYREAAEAHAASEPGLSIGCWTPLAEFIAV
jgi:hypothetical protein